MPQSSLVPSVAVFPLAMAALLCPPTRGQQTGAATEKPADKPADKQTEKPASQEVHWNEIVAGSSKIKFYGMLRLDAFYDDSRPNNTQTIGWIRSEDPSATPDIGAPRNSEDFTMHPRLTRFGFDLDGPKVSSLGDAKATGKLEFDFYNNALIVQAESREAVRMRHAYLKLTWEELDLSLLAGQTNDVISPLFPVVNSDLVMWGAGNLGDRRPQLRPEFTPQVGEGRLIVQGEIGLTGADDNADIDPSGAIGNGYRDGETSGMPTLQARVAYRHPLWAEQKQNVEFGVWVHRSWEEPDTSFVGNHRFDSTAFGFDLMLPVYQDLLWVKTEFWRGENVDDVRGGIFQGINTILGREIGSQGGFVEVGVRPLQRVALYAGWSTDDPENDDLSVKARSLNKIWYGAARLNFDPIEIGLEYLHWRTEYIGFGAGDDNRYGMFISYKF